MTNPLKNLTLTGYVGAQAGHVQSTQLGYHDAGLVLGAEARYNNVFLRGQLGAGTAFSGKIQAGYDFDLGKNMGLELSAKAQIGQSVRPHELITNVYTNREIATVNSTYIGGNSHAVTSSDVTETVKEYFLIEVPNGEKKAGAEVMLTYEGKKIDAGIGFEGGIHKSMMPNYNIDIDSELTSIVAHEHEYTDDNMVDNITAGIITSQTLNNDSNVQIKNEAKLYGTPTGFVKYKPTENLSIKLEGNLYEQHLGLEYKLHNKKPKERPWYGN